MANYTSQAQQILNGNYQAAVGQIQNNYNNDLQELEYQKGQANKQFDDYVKQAQQTGEMNKAGYSDNMLNRGMGRSTIATTGITGIDNTTANNVNSLNVERQAQMENIARLKATLRNNLTNALNSEKSKYNSDIANLAMQLKQKDEEMALRKQESTTTTSKIDTDNVYSDAYSTMMKLKSQGKKEEALAVMETALGYSISETQAKRLQAIYDGIDARKQYYKPNNNPYQDMGGKTTEKMTGSRIY